MLKLAIVIPTWNRLDKLVKNIESIQSQKFDESLIEVFVYVHNSCSSDGTDEYLSQINNKKINGIFLRGFNSVNLNESGEPIHVGVFENYRRAINVVEDADWILTLGDDDKLNHQNAISGILSAIRLCQKDHDVQLIHFCQARRSKRTGRVIVNDLKQLCNSIGFHEILGWMSSICATAEVWRAAVNSDIYLNSQSAYAHSSGLFYAAYDKKSAFIDSDYVEPQDQVQSEESIKRWELENIGERYFYIVDDLIKMKDCAKLKNTLNPIFFRYLTYSLWDRYLQYIMARVINSAEYGSVLKGHMHRIREIEDFLLLPIDRGNLARLVLNTEALIDSYVQSANVTNASKSKLIDSYKLASSTIYPFTNL